MRKDGQGDYREAVSYIQKVSAILDKKMIVGSLARNLPLGVCQIWGNFLEYHQSFRS